MTLFTRTLRAATLGLLLSCSMATFAADGALEIETKVPATLSGKLGYASMKYWVEVPGQGAVEIWTDDEAYWLITSCRSANNIMPITIFLPALTASFFYSA